MVEDEYNFLDRILTSDYSRAEIELCPYTDYEKMNIVQAMDNLARETGLEKYIKGYRGGETAKLLDIDRNTVEYRDRCVKAKIEIMRGLI